MCARTTLGADRTTLLHLRRVLFTSEMAFLPLTGRPSSLRSGRCKGTKTPFEAHTLRCRVRRKRERLTSNGSIESDAATKRRVFTQAKCAASLPIEC